MLYKFKAIKQDGTKYSGSVEAADKMAVYHDMKAKGETVIYVEDSEEEASSKFKFPMPSFGKVKAQDKILFAKNISAMLSAGLPLSKALSVISRETHSKSFKKALETIQDSITKGQPLSLSLKAFPDIFPALMVSMVAAGEESGNIAESLKIVGEQLEKSYLLQKKVKGAMIYPGIIFGVMIIIAILMFVFVVPRITETFIDFNIELPLSTRFVMATSNILQHYYILVLLIVIAIVFLVKMYARTKDGKSLIHKLYLKLPVIGLIVKEVNSARVARTMSSLLTAGVDMLSSINITSDVVQNYHYQVMLKETSLSVEKGELLSPIFLKRPDIFPIFVGEMIGVGEETGTLSKTFAEIALFYENEVEQKTKDLSTIIEPILMVFIGAAVGFFAFSILTPIYSLVNTI